VIAPWPGVPIYRRRFNLGGYSASSCARARARECSCKWAADGSGLFRAECLLVRSLQVIVMPNDYGIFAQFTRQNSLRVEKLFVAGVLRTPFLNYSLKQPNLAQRISIFG
jgi:hypothetical protein